MLRREDILKIPDMRKAGKTQAQIAKDLGVSISTIVRWMGRLRIAGYDVPKSKGGIKKIEL